MEILRLYTQKVNEPFFKLPLTIFTNSNNKQLLRARRVVQSSSTHCVKLWALFLTINQKDYPFSMRNSSGYSYIMEDKIF